MKRGLYAGSFDPYTFGHHHVVKTSAQLFDEVIVAVGVNPNKTRRFSKEKMIKAMQKLYEREGLNNVKVVIYTDLTVDVATQHGAEYFIRGIRNGMDYAYEENIASTNMELSGIDTIFVRAGNLGNVSSSMVVELMHHGRDVSKYVPYEILEVIS